MVDTLINLLPWQPGFSGFTSYIKRSLNNIPGTRLQVNNHGIVDLISENNWHAYPPPIAEKIHMRVLQRLSLLQYGVDLHQLLNGSTVKYDDIAVIYSPFLDYLVECANIPQVITCPDFIPILQKNSFRSYLRALLIQSSYLNNSHTIITYCEYVADQLIKFGVNKSRICTIPCGIDVVRNRVISPSSEDLILIARHDKHKNLTFFIRALMQFQLQNKSWNGNVMIIGKEGKMTKHLRELVQNLPRPEKVVFIKEISRKKMIEYLRSSFVLIAPSLEEGFDYPVLEAKAEGIPTIISDIPVHREFHSSSSLIFSPCGDVSSFCKCLNALLCDNTLWNELSINGYNLAKSMSIQDQVSNIKNQLKLTINK